MLGEMSLPTTVPDQEPVKTGKSIYKKCISHNTVKRMDYFIKGFLIFLLLTILICCIFFAIKKPVVTFEKLYSSPENYPLLIWHTAAPAFCADSNRALQCPMGPKTVYCATTSNRDLKMADAYLFYGPWINFSDLPLVRSPKTIWGLFTDKPPQGQQELLQENTLNLFNYSSTCSRYSDVPTPLTWMLSTNLQSLVDKFLWMPTEVKNRMLKDSAAIMYIQSSCDFSCNDAYVRELQEYINIDIFNKCESESQSKSVSNVTQNQGNNSEVDNWTWTCDDFQVLQHFGRYKFLIIIDSNACSDYVSEHVWRALRLGIVPIYFGSPLISTWLPNPKSAVLIEDYSTPESLADHLKMLLDDDQAYEEYLTHKTEGIIANTRLHDELQFRPYQMDIHDAVHEFECFVCKKLHIKKTAPEKYQETKIMTKKEYNCYN